MHSQAFDPGDQFAGRVGRVVHAAQQHGLVEQDKIQDLRDSGANDFLQKPFEVEALLGRMCELLDMEKTSSRPLR